MDEDVDESLFCPKKMMMMMMCVCLPTKNKLQLNLLKYSHLKIQDVCLHRLE